MYIYTIPSEIDTNGMVFGLPKVSVSRLIPRLDKGVQKVLLQLDQFFLISVIKFMYWLTKRDHNVYQWKIYLNAIRKYKIDMIKISFAQAFVNLDNTAVQIFFS